MGTWVGSRGGDLDWRLKKVNEQAGWAFVGRAFAQLVGWPEA